ncbi:MAG: hypothetical protein O3A00_12265 [Planctomycetota bacterium]|nr:hypothetical protein [Planctomycetota bacterium]
MSIYTQSETRTPQSRQLCLLCGAEFASVNQVCPTCGEDSKVQPRRDSIFVFLTLVVLAVASSAFFGVLIGTIALTMAVGSWFVRTSRVPVTVYICTAVIAWPTTAICKYLLLEATYEIGYATAVRETELHRSAGTMDEFMLVLIRCKFRRENPRFGEWEPVRRFHHGYSRGWRSCFPKRIDIRELARERITKKLNATILRDDRHFVIGIIIRQSDELQLDDLVLLAAFPDLKLLVLDGITVGNDAVNYIAPLEIQRLDLIGTNVTDYYDVVGKLQIPRELRIADQELTTETRKKIERRYPTAKLVDFGRGEDAIRRCRNAIHGE